MNQPDLYLTFFTRNSEGQQIHGAYKVSTSQRQLTVDGKPAVEVEAVGAFQGMGEPRQQYTNRKRVLTMARGYNGETVDGVQVYSFRRADDMRNVDLN